MAAENGSSSKPKKHIFVKFDPDDETLKEVLKLKQDLQLIDEELGMGQKKPISVAFC